MATHLARVVQPLLPDNLDKKSVDAPGLPGPFSLAWC